MKNESATHQVTKALRAIRAGDEKASDRLISLVYAELRRMARAQMAREAPGQTLQPTALVHEAYIRLVGKDHPVWENRAHFFSAAAEAMRRILIERARRRSRLKRGGDRKRVKFDSGVASTEPYSDELLALDQALSRLEAQDPAMARVVKLRYFAGFTGDETAAILRVNPRDVDRHWAAARAWLKREMSRNS